MSGHGRQRATRRTPARARRAPLDAEPRRRPGHVLPRLLRHPPAWAVALVLAAAHLALALVVFDPTVFTGGDNGAYLALAHSLLERHAYLSTWLPGAPPHTQYPPVFPGMIALGLLLGVRSWVGIKLIIVLCSTAAVALTYLWLRRRRRPGLALGVTVLVALSPGILALSHQELSDLPFFALAMLALWAFERLGPRERLRFALGAAAVVLAFFTRSAGLPLVLAALAWLAFKRRWRHLAIFAAVMVPLGGLWWLRGRLAGGSVYAQLFWYIDPYRPELGTLGPGTLVRRVFANERTYLGTSVPVLFAEQVTPVLAIVGYAVAILAVYGWVVRLRRPQLAEFFFPLYVGLLFVWPEVWAGERFLLPAFPLLLAYAGDGAVRLLRRLEQRAVAPAAFAAVGILGLLALPPINTDASAASVCRQEFVATGGMGCLDTSWQDYFQIGYWVRTALPANAVVISRKPALFFAFSNRPGIDIPKTQRPEEYFREAERAGARYLVLDRTDALSSVYSVPVILRYPDSFCIIRSGYSSGAALLGIRLEAPRVPSTSGQQPNLAPCPASYLAPSARQP